MKFSGQELLELVSVIIVGLVAYYPLLWLLKNEQLAGAFGAAVALFLHDFYKDFLKGKKDR